jgi:DnaK suppressor protein
MFVSILQLMGFSSGKPVHSRAGESPPLAPAKPLVNVSPSSLSDDAAGKQRESIHKIQRQVKPVRRPTVTTQTVKTKTSAAKVSKAIEPKVAKASVKATVKIPKKSVSVPVAAKAATPAKPVKPVKPVKAETKPLKAQNKPKPAVSPPKNKSEPVTAKIKTPLAAVPIVPIAPVMPVKPVATDANLTATGVPVRSGRPSSRLAQLTVPSMAQSVASTAAKASFTQITASTPIVSPLASSIKKDVKLANNWKNKPVDQLTDAEVMAMSDDDYMNDVQLAFFRLKLVTLKNNMLSNAVDTTEHLREDTVVVPDPADRATIEEEHALELRTRDRERKLLKKVEQSIARIDSGDYGYCDETGEAIGVGRLLARPTANLSLEAQQRRELKQKMFGD